MATVSKALFRGAATTSSTTLYTVPSSTTAVVTNIAVTNEAATSATFTILLDDVELQKDSTLAANSTAYIDLKQVLATTKTIKGFASAITVNFHISGVEIA
jgi:hypothetical protein